jgi:alkaline phosphatase D
VAANQAWFEFIPARLTDAVSADGVANEARDFAPTPMREVTGDAATEAEIARAVASITIYRTVRWGQHAELVLTDTRSYRTDHPVPDALGLAISSTGRYFLPRHVVDTFDAGRTANNGAAPTTIRVGAEEIPNLRRMSEPGSMLGESQRAWWKSVMRASTATWKLWASSVPVQPVWFDVERLVPGATTTVFSTDTWDGYPGERRELLQFLRTERISNVVVLSGDNHNTFAGTLVPNHPDGTAGVAVEFSIAGISSPSIFEAFADAIAPDNPMRAIVVFDDTRFGGQDPRCAALNVTLRHGVQSAVALQTSGNPQRALAARNPAQNPHLAYMDTKANGIGVLTVDGSRCRTQLWTFAPPLGPVAERLRIAHFETLVRAGDQPVMLAEPRIEGTPPFPYDRLPASR